jgi:hypothetical protein
MKLNAYYALLLIEFIIIIINLMNVDALFMKHTFRDEPHEKMSNVIISKLGTYQRFPSSSSLVRRTNK